jgi:hypothetical protein
MGSGPLLLNAFPEPWIDGERAGVSFVAEADFDGVVVFTNWRRSEIIRGLPPGLRPGLNISSTPDIHPLAFVFGTQSRAGLIFGGVSLPTAVQFHELVIAVPFVRHEDGRNLHVFVPRIYSGDVVSTWSGNAQYGLSKQLAEFRSFAATYAVSARGGPLLLHATVEPTGQWSSCRDLVPPDLCAVTEVFRLPILGRRSDGTEACSYFAWDLRHASARRVRAVVSIDAPLGAGLDPGVFHGVESSTFEVRGMRWRVSWPQRCRR